MAEMHQLLFIVKKQLIFLFFKVIINTNFIKALMRRVGNSFCFREKSSGVSFLLMITEDHLGAALIRHGLIPLSSLLSGRIYASSWVEPRVHYNSSLYFLETEVHGAFFIAFCSK